MLFLGGCGLRVEEVSPAEGESVNLLNDEIREWLTDYVQCDSTISGHLENRSAMKDVVLSWKEIPGAEYYVVRILDEDEKDDPLVLDTTTPSLNLGGLVPGQDYSWWVGAVGKSGRMKFSRKMRFHVEDTPFLVSIEGVDNTRDIGGYPCDGGHIRRGVLYRGGRMNTSDSTLITPEGILYCRDGLGIVTDFDLRSGSSSQSSETGGIVESPLGPDVRYVNISTPVYSQMFLPEWKDAVVNLISALADPEAYPAYIHCSLGRDRTGLTCWIIETLCGVSWEDTCIDYELSFFSQVGKLDPTPVWIMHQQIDPVARRIGEYVPGGTLRDNLEKYLTDLGAKPEDIASIREIFIEKD